MSHDQVTHLKEFCAIPLHVLSTRRARFLMEADRLFPWDRWQAMIEPHYPKRRRGRPPYPLRPLLRLYLLRQWFGLSDAAAQEVATDSMAVRGFLGMGLVWSGQGAPPDESTILNFRRLLERHGLAAEIASDAARCLAGQGWQIRPGAIAEAALMGARV